MSYELLSKLFYKDSNHYEEKYLQRYHSEFSIKIPILIHHNEAFFTTPIDMINKIEKIYKANNKLNFYVNKLPSIAIDFLVSKSLKDEITLTNEIEGVSSTRKEVEHAIFLQNSDKKTRFKGLAAKYIKLIEDNDVPLNTCLDIRNIYDDIVLDEIEPENTPDGTYFRKDMVHVVSATQKEKHRGVMPEEKKIENMETCLSFIKDENVNMLIKSAVFHYLFGYIHPFYDGNGRTSRFISSCLLKDELGILLCLRLSYVIKNHIKDYYRAFDICNDDKNKGDITYFILMFLDLLEEASFDLGLKLHELSDKLEYYNYNLTKLKLTKSKRDILYILCQNALFDDSYIMVSELKVACELSETSIRGLLKEIDQSYGLHKMKYGKKIGYRIDLTMLEP